MRMGGDNNGETNLPHSATRVALVMRFLGLGI